MCTASYKQRKTAGQVRGNSLKLGRYNKTEPAMGSPVAEVRDEDDKELLADAVQSQIWFLGIKDYLTQGGSSLGRASEVEMGRVAMLELEARYFRKWPSSQEQAGVESYRKPTVRLPRLCLRDTYPEPSKVLVKISTWSVGCGDCSHYY